MLTNKSSRLVFVTLLLVLITQLGLIFSKLSTPTTFAQTAKEKTFPLPVTATMPDVQPPSTPVLISPKNGELISSAKPQFVWQASTDNVAISHYQLFIDGRLVIDNIMEPGVFDLYNLIYNRELGWFYLDIKFDLDQGTHTWKITAVDTAGHPASSAVWSFIVDSIAPHFSLTQIGDTEVSISTLDLTTIPKEPLKILENEPLLTGIGEAMSEVQLTVIIPNQDDHFSKTSIDEYGHWEYPLPILPRETVITLNFVVVDLARHVTVLEGVQLIIPSEAPVPKEIVYDFVRWLTPTPIWRIGSKTWFQQVIQTTGPWLVVLIVTWPALLATLLLMSKMGWIVSSKNLIKIWQTLGVIPYQDREGWVFDSQLIFNPSKAGVSFSAGIPFARVFAIGEPKHPGFPPFYQTVLTDHLGLYLPLDLNINKYRLSIQHQDFRYPTRHTPPNEVSILDFYQAQELETSHNYPSLSLQIPADSDRAELKTDPWSLKTKLQVWLAKVIKFDSLVVLLNILLSIVVSLFWTTPINLIALAIYLIFGLFYLFKQRVLANISGVIVDKNGNFVQNAMVRLINQDGTGKIFADISDKDGRFKFFFKKGLYKVDASKYGLRQVKETELENQLEVGAWWEKKRLLVMMKRD